MNHRVLPDYGLMLRAGGLAILWAALLWMNPLQNASAQGFGVYEQGTCAMARAGTGVADSCNDASGIFYNPALLAGSEGWTISGGATLIAAGGSFTDDITGRTTDLQNSPIPVPHLYASYGFSPEWAVGLGVYVPYGLATEWDRSFDGAFEGYDNSVESIYIQPTVSYQFDDRISIGGGPIMVIGAVELNQLVDLSSQELGDSGITFGQLGVPFHTAFADSQLEGSGTIGFGGHFGIKYKVTDRIRLGGRMLFPVQLDYEGDATFDQIETGLPLTEQFRNIIGLPGGAFPGIDNPTLDDFLGGESPLVAGPFADGAALSDQSLETSLTMPAQVVLGVSVDVTERLTVLADYQWTQWSSFDEIVLEFENQDEPVIREENYNDTNAIRLGAEYQLADAWMLRGGYLFNQAAAPDEVVTPLLPENDRNHITVGVGWQASDMLRLDASYQYLGQNDRRGRTRGLAEGRPDTNGLYSFDAHLVGLTFALSL